MITRRLALMGLGAVVGIGAITAPPLLGIRKIQPQGAPAPDPWSALATVLRAVVDGGFVRWELLRSEPLRAQLESVCAALAEWGPRTAPRDFTDEDAQVAYLINAYNALVLLGVVRSWPIRSVDDVHGPIQPARHFGFFYGLRFRLDRAWVTLHGLEQGQLFALRPDARIHAAINCASYSCPPLRPEPFAGPTLDAQLDAACRDWLRGSVSLDPSAQRVVAPPLFAFYPKEFAAHARAEGWGEGWIDFVLHWLPEEERAPIEAKLGRGWQPYAPPYDWRLNQRR